MTIKIPRKMIRQLELKIRDQKKRIERATAYLEELETALASVEPSSDKYSGNAKGGEMRALKLNAKQRSDIAKRAAKVRWGRDAIGK